MIKKPDLNTPQPEQDATQEKFWAYCWFAIENFIKKYRKAGMHEVVKKPRRHYERKK